MSLIGQCDDCGIDAVQLWYKPNVDESRPSICHNCKIDREERAREHRQSFRLAPEFPDEGGAP